MLYTLIPYPTISHFTATKRLKPKDQITQHIATVNVLKMQIV